MLSSGADRQSSKRRRERYAKLKPCMETVDKLLKAGVFNAVVIYRDIQALGYDGKIRVLRAYIEPKRALRSGRATVRFETEPAKQLQHDWGEVDRAHRRDCSESPYCGERARLLAALPCHGGALL